MPLKFVLSFSVICCVFDEVVVITQRPDFRLRWSHQHTDPSPPNIADDAIDRIRGQVFKGVRYHRGDHEYRGLDRVSLVSE